MAAARAWAAGTLVAAPAQIETSDAMADAKAWGASAEDLAGLARHLGIGAGDIAVWPVNVAAVTAFCRVGTQWRTTTVMIDGVIVTRYIGLDYAGAGVALDAWGISLSADIMAGLSIMELAARDALNGEAA